MPPPREPYGNQPFWSGRECPYSCLSPDRQRSHGRPAFARPNAASPGTVFQMPSRRKFPCLRRGWVMVAAPLAARSERVRHGQDDQGQHPGRPLKAVRLSGWVPRLKLIAGPLRLDECPGVGDPIDALAHLLESLRFGVCARMPLRASIRARTGNPCSRAR
jgi:hypothetical protein